MDTATRVQILDETAFHIALIPLGKVWIQLFSLQLWVNGRTDWFLQAWQLVYEKENSEFKPVKLRLKVDLVSYPAQAERLVNRTNQSNHEAPVMLELLGMSSVMFWPFDPAKNAIQGDAPEGSDTF